jgi:outer membrane protein assembly factor BamA
VPGYFTRPFSSTLSVTDSTNHGYGRALGLQIPDLLIVSEARYSDYNFLGTAKRLEIPLKYGFSSTSLHRYASFAPAYTDPRFLFQGLTFSFTPFVLYDRATLKLDEFEFGVEFRLTKMLLSGVIANISLRESEISTKPPYETGSFSPLRFQNKLKPSLTVNKLDHPINPMKGYSASVVLSYINALKDQAFQNYLKYEIFLKGFLSIKNKVSLGAYYHLGNSRSFQSDHLPPEERFTLGGNKGVRGFIDDGISQYNPDGTLKLTQKGDPPAYSKIYGGDSAMNGSFELRFPFISKLGFWGCFFFDYGAVGENLDDLWGESIRSSIGFGLRYLIGDQIPFRLDYGMILDRRCKDVDPATGACVLKEEFGNIHLGILYTF